MKLLCLILLCSVVRAEIESPLVRAGLSAYERADLPRAVELLTRALGESLTREEKAAAEKTLGFAEVALGHGDRARAAFEALLSVEPDFDLDARVSPRVRSVFEEARAAVATRPPPMPAAPALHPTLSPQHPSEGAPLQVTVEHPGGLAARASLFHRLRGAGAYSRVDVTGRDGRFDARVPGEAVRAPGVDYYVVIYDERGLPLAHAGSLGTPLSVEVAARKKPVYRRAWFWGTLAGSVAAAVIVGVAVGVATAPKPVHLVVQPQ